MMSALRRFAGDRRGASALEFAILASPFFLLLLGLIQLSIYYMAQTALNSGVTLTADALRAQFNPVTAGATFSPWPAAAVKNSVATNAGALINNDQTLAVDVQQLATLSLLSIPVTNGTADFGSNTSPLVLRAQAQVPSFLPGFNNLVVHSSAIIRRSGT